MVKVHIAVVIILLLSACLFGEVVINEILYDSEGTDTGNEWIELYNNGNSDVNLEGARLQVAGTQFTDVFIFPGYVLRAGRYVLIGEANIIEAAFITPLVMQNGGDATDGVRYVGPDGIYTDTVLYDYPNTNGLINDYGYEDYNSTDDVEPGNSLARVVNGVDNNDCFMDFAETADPTPGLPNPILLDYWLSGIYVDANESYSTLSCNIYNLTYVYIDTLDVKLKVSLNGQVLHLFTIEPIPALETNYFYEEIDIDTYSTGTLLIELIVYNDINPANNVYTLELGQPQYGILKINEIMYNPESDNQEWVEIVVPNWVSPDYFFTLTDAADNDVIVTLPLLCPEFIVVCEDQADLLLRYPDCPPYNVIQINNLPALNNEGDYLVLRDNYGVVMDSMSYVGISSKRDISLERQVFSDSTVSWHYCLDEAGGTPGQPNSEVPPPPEIELGKIKLVGSPFNPQTGESMYLQYNFRDDRNTISCIIYDLQGRKRHTITSGLEINNAGEIAWNGKDNSGKPLPRGIYILLTEARNSNKNIILRKQHTVVLATK